MHVLRMMLLVCRLNMDKRIIYLRLIDGFCYGMELAQLHRIQYLPRHSPVDDDAEQMVVAEAAEVVAMASGEFSVRDAYAPAMGILAAKFSQLKLKWTMDIGQRSFDWIEATPMAHVDRE